MRKRMTEVYIQPRITTAEDARKLKLLSAWGRLIPILRALPGLGVSREKGHETTYQGLGLFLGFCSLNIH